MNRKLERNKKIFRDIIDGQSMQKVADGLGLSYSTVRECFYREFRRVAPALYEEGSPTYLHPPPLHWCRRHRSEILTVLDLIEAVTTQE